MHYPWPHSGLLTDYYQLTMAQAYFRQKRHNADSVFQLFFRKNPFNGNFTIAAGINDALNFIENYSFDDESLSFLASVRHAQEPVFTDDFLQFLKTLHNHIDVYGVTDGDVVFPHEPLLRLEGPLFLCQMLETPLLNIINFQSLIATKAQRIVMAANHKPIIDFGLRRAQGFDGAISATKAAFIGGVKATSNLWAAKEYGIEKAGTQAHSFIMSYEHETDAFSSFADAFPRNCILLIDTYDAKLGLQNALRIFRERKPSHMGIRIDSGDLLALSKMARTTLDDNQFFDCKIMVSGDLDEYEIERLEMSHAPIDSYGVGTKLVTAFDEPSLGGVYKLVAIKENGKVRNTFKTSATASKTTVPGAKSIARFFKNGSMAFDHVYDKNINDPKTLAKNDFDHMDILHRHLMHKGKRIEAAKNLYEYQKNAALNVARLPTTTQKIKAADNIYPVYF